MNTRVIAVLLALALGARTAEAANGFNITWDRCQAAGGLSEKTFDCADIAALDNIVVSFKPPVDMPGFVGLEAEIGITGSGGPLPEYWQLGPGECNDGSWVVSTTPPPGSAAACLATWGAGGAVTQTSYETPVKGDVSRAKFHVWITRSPIGLLAANEYFGFRIQLSRENAPFCAGCDDKIFIALHNVRLLDRVCPGPLRAQVMTTPLVVDQISNTGLLDVQPGEARLSLAGTRQNPVPGGEAMVSFTLPDASPAWLELLDIAGRRVVRLEVGSLGPGQHQVRLSRDGAIPPGVYQLRLSNAQAARVRKTVIVQ